MPLELVRAFVRGEVKALDVEGNTFLATMSSESDDRDGDTIRQEGWNLYNFLKHPVLLDSHVYEGVERQIGEWHDVHVDGKSLKGTAEYYAGVGNKAADYAMFLAKRGKAAFSVGFIPGDYKMKDEKGGWNSPIEFVKGHELLETSAVPIPAHPEALQEMAKSLRKTAESRRVDPVLLAYVEELAAESKTSKDMYGEDDDEFCCVPGCEDVSVIDVDICRTHLADLLGTAKAADALSVTSKAELAEIISRLEAQEREIATLKDAGGIELGKTVEVEPPAPEPHVASIDWSTVIADLFKES